MNVEDLKAFEEVIDIEKGEERELFLNGLKKEIELAEKDAKGELASEIERLKDKYSIGGGSKKKEAPKSEPKKVVPAKKEKQKATPEAKAEKQKKVTNATAKTVDECKEILAKYESMRQKTNDNEKERIADLKDSGKVIEGTNVIDATATTEKVTKQVQDKINKEVDAIQKIAETEAKKEVDKDGKTATEIKKEVEKIVEQKVEQEIIKMTDDLAEASTNFIKQIQSQIAKYSKDDAKKFLIDVRKNIDLLLRAYGYGGDIASGVEAYSVPWMGGKPDMFKEGGKLKGKGSRAKNEYNKEVDSYKWFVVNLNEKKAISGFEHKEDAIDLMNDYEDDSNLFKVIAKSQLKRFGIADPTEEWKYKFAKGGSIKNKSYISAIIDSSVKGSYEKQIKNLLDEHYMDYYIDTNNSEGVVYEIGEPRDGQFEYDVKALIKKANKGKASMDIYSVYQDIDNWDYFDFAKGGQTRSKRSRATDRNRLSNEPWEQAYLPNRKGSYYATGGILPLSDKAKARGMSEEDFINHIMQNPKMYDNDTFIQALNTRSFM